MSARSKKEVRVILGARDLIALEKWILNTRAPLRTLFSLTYDADALIRWRAIEAIGRAAKIIGEFDIEKVCVFLRGLMWLMTDESGGIGWHAPEAIAEVLFNVPSLVEKYSRLLPQYMSEESFAPGACAALNRIAPLKPDLICEHASILTVLLTDPDPDTRAYAAMALGAVRAEIPLKTAEKLGRDKAEIEIYDFDTGEMKKTTVRQIVSKILALCKVSENNEEVGNSKGCQSLGIQTKE
ncbi:MAG: hypothetical protein GY847_21080 [Proteobacteria bacterium]|nr:hypothetical protein [Pseudomonadota bacterium]